VNERKAGCSTPRSTHRLLPRHGRASEPLADERHVPSAQRGPREAVRQAATAAGSTVSRDTAPSAACGRRSTTRSPRRVTALVEFMREFGARTADQAPDQDCVGGRWAACGPSPAAPARTARRIVVRSGRVALERRRRFDEAAPVFQHLRRVAVNLHPRHRLPERPAVVKAAGPRRERQVGQPRCRLRICRRRSTSRRASGSMPSAGAGSS